MKNLNTFWNQLVSPFVASPTNNNQCKRTNPIGKRKKFLHRLIYGRQSVSSTSSSTSCSSSSTYSPVSISTCSSLSYYNPSRLQYEQRSLSCDRIVEQLAQSDATEATSSFRYSHLRNCHCNDCLPQHYCQERKLNVCPIDVITEEEEEEVDKDLEVMPRDIKFLSRRMDKIEPFQRADQLNPYWQQPNEPLSVVCNEENGADNVSKISMPILLSDHYPSTQTSAYDDDGRRSSASNFIRAHNLRSSCPPTARRRRRKLSTVNNSQTASATTSAGSPTANVPNSPNNSTNSGLVETIHSKLSSVRKSWLFSIFQPTHSKVINVHSL